MGGGLEIVTEGGSGDGERSDRRGRIGTTALQVTVPGLCNIWAE
jgi:hypothetical protein